MFRYRIVDSARISAAQREENSRLAKPAAAIHGRLRSDSASLSRPASLGYDAARCDFSSRCAATYVEALGPDDANSLFLADFE